MGTNYYRIPSVEEMENRKKILLNEVESLDINPSSTLSNFRRPRPIKMDDYGEGMNPWEMFTNDVEIHLGKRSGGWKFLWNFHNKRYYSNKEELLNFIRTGRVIDEYFKEIDVEEFITMTLEWCQPNGYDDMSYRIDYPHEYYYNFEKSEEYIDGLRVSAHTVFS